MSLYLRKVLLFGFAVITMSALYVATFVIGRLSTWVVDHGPGDAHMDSDVTIATIFYSRSDFGELFQLALVCSIGFLVFLWHTLFRADVRSNSSHETG